MGVIDTNLRRGYEIILRYNPLALMARAVQPVHHVERQPVLVRVKSGNNLYERKPRNYFGEPVDGPLIPGEHDEGIGSGLSHFVQHEGTHPYDGLANTHGLEVTGEELKESNGLGQILDVSG